MAGKVKLKDSIDGKHPPNSDEQGKIAAQIKIEDQDERNSMARSNECYQMDSARSEAQILRHNLS